MSVAYVQNITAWGNGGSGAQTSGSFTATGGDYLAVVSLDSAASGQTLVFSGSLNTPIQQSIVNDTTDGNTIGMGAVNSITGGSQTLTVTQSITSGYAVEYGGVVSTAYNTNHPLSTTTPTGIATSVPSGSTMLAFAVILSGTGSAITPSASGGITPTSRGSGTNSNNYCWAEWIGTGSTVTPTFSGASGDYVVLQVLLTGAAAGPTINTQPFNVYLAPEQTGVFSVTATTSGGALSYQWQDNRTGSFANCTDGSGATTATYATGALGFAAQGRLYQCLVTDSNGTTTSATASVTELENDSANILRRTRNHQGGIVMGLNILEWF